MGEWDLSPSRLRAANPGLIVCSLSGFGLSGPWSDRVAHDLNLTASSGLLARMAPASGLPQVQIADVTTAILACSGVLGALLLRGRTGVGRVVDQPLATGVVPLLAWAMADVAAGGQTLGETVLAGRCPAYRTYECGDGCSIALGALEPRFWAEFVEMLGLGELESVGLDIGEAGGRASQRVAEVLAEQESDYWLRAARERNLPITPVQSLDEAIQNGFFSNTGLAEQEPSPKEGVLPGPFVPSIASRPRGGAPRLGEHTEAVLSEHGISVDDD
jgi:alpha-methylacyl-CoA racemase